MPSQQHSFDSSVTKNTSAGFKFLFSACSLSVHGKLGHKVNLGLDAEPLVPLLGDGQLDTLALGQRDERLVALKDMNEMRKEGNKCI